MRLLPTATAAVLYLMASVPAIAASPLDALPGKVIQTDTLTFYGNRKFRAREKTRLQFIDNEKITVTEPIRFSGKRKQE